MLRSLVRRKKKTDYGKRTTPTREDTGGGEWSTLVGVATSGSEHGGKIVLAWAALGVKLGCWTRLASRRMAGFASLNNHLHRIVSSAFGGESLFSAQVKP